MNSNLMKFLMLVLGFALWGALGYFGKVPLDPLIALLQMGLGGLITHMLQAGGDATVPSAPAAPAAPSNPQSGFANIRFLVLMAFFTLVAAALSAGCTTTTASMYSGLYTQAKAGVQVFDDNTLHTARDIICAQPYSAIQRNTDLQPGVQVLCGPLANATSLDAGQLQLLMSVVGKAQAAGLLATPPAPAASSAK